jgi:hypothetical protein
MKLVSSIIGFLCAAWLGGLASYNLLDVYEHGRPFFWEAPSEERDERITKHKRKTAFKGGICCGVIWLLWYLWPWLSTV